MSTLLSLSSIEQFLRLVNMTHGTQFNSRIVTVGLPQALTNQTKNTLVRITPVYNKGWKGIKDIKYNRLPLSGFSRYGAADFPLPIGADIAYLITAFNVRYKSALSPVDDIDVRIALPALDYFSNNYTITANVNSLAYVGNFTVSVRKAQGPLVNGTVANGVTSPAAVNSHSGAIVGDVLYIQGGNTGSLNVNHFRAYNLITKVWTSKATGPSARSGANMVSLNGLIYVCCGSGNRDLREYNPVADKWKQLAMLPSGKGRDFSAMTVANGKIYLHGGGTASGNLDDLFVYDPSTNRWTELAKSPEARQMHSLAALSDRLYVIGGGRTSLGLVTPDPVVHCYNISTNSWSAVAPNPDPQVYATATEVNGYIYCYGGGNESQVSKLQRFDPVSNTWTNLGNVGSVRAKHIMARYGNKLIVHGGTSGSVLGTTIELL